MAGENNPAKRKDVREKISKNRKGKRGRYGFSQTKETRQKISEALRGKKRPWSAKSLTEDGRLRISESRKGENNWNWKGGITPINEKIRKSIQYKDWRTSVFGRDNWRCVWCGKGGYVEADHIKQFAYYPELRFTIDNGRTLCKPCHNTTKNGRPKKL